MTVEDIRRHFPELSEYVYGKPLVYFDNAATSQRPDTVISKWNELSVKYNSNLHRAVHRIAALATKEYEDTRTAVARYIGAESEEEIVFTSGTTQSINLLAFSFGEAFIKEGDEILVTEAEHHSNIVPWKMMCERKGAILKHIEVDEYGKLNPDTLSTMLTDKVKLVCVCHISNVLGLVNPVEKIISVCHSKGCPVFVDGAQGIVHRRVNVCELDCDFYAFSGHKIYAAPGTGVLYGKKKWLQQLPPYMGGGEMIESVSWSEITYSDSPHKFEAGTQNMASIPTLVQAFEMASMMQDSQIEKEAEAVSRYLKTGLESRGDTVVYGRGDSDKIALYSFTVDGVHHEDLALLLDKMGIAVRSGQMCAEPLMNRFSVTGMTRISLAPYNTMQEAEYFLNSLDKAVKMLRV